MSVIVAKALPYYVERMSLRPLFAVLIGFALLFAPLGAIGGGAMAQGPAAGHHAQMMDSGHCDDQPATDKDGKSFSKSCCIAMCAAVAIIAVGPAEPRALGSSTDRPSLAKFDPGVLTELPTPPPRLA